MAKCEKCGKIFKAKDAKYMREINPHGTDRILKVCPECKGK
jgi:hypothetical protein